MRIVTKQQATAGLAIPGTTSAADLAIKKNRAVRIVRLVTKRRVHAEPAPADTTSAVTLVLHENIAEIIAQIIIL